MSIRITGKKKAKGGGAWIAEYTVRDDRGLYVAQGVGYTRSAKNSLMPDAPVMDREALTRYAVEGRLKRAESRTNTAAERKRREHAIRDRLREVLEQLTPQAQAELLAELERKVQGALKASQAASQEEAA